MRTKPFVMVYREVDQDGRLSLEARGLFMLMTSLPDSWRYTVAGLAKMAGAAGADCAGCWRSWSAFSARMGPGSKCVPTFD